MSLKLKVFTFETKQVLFQVHNRKIIETDYNKVEYMTPENMYQLKISKDYPKHFKFKTSNKQCLITNVQCFELNQGCSEAGLGLIYHLRKIEIRQKICKSNKVYKQKLPLNGSLTTKAWLTSNHKEFICNIWCTNQ